MQVPNEPVLLRQGTLAAEGSSPPQSNTTRNTGIQFGCAVVTRVAGLDDGNHEVIMDTASYAVVKANVYRLDGINSIEDGLRYTSAFHRRFALRRDGRKQLSAHEHPRSRLCLARSTTSEPPPMASGGRDCQRRPDGHIGRSVIQP